MIATEEITKHQVLKIIDKMYGKLIIVRLDFFPCLLLMMYEELMLNLHTVTIYTTIILLNKS